MIKYVCVICEKEFSDYESEQRKFCSVKCKAEYQKQYQNEGCFVKGHSGGFKKGYVPWNKGKKMSQEFIDKISGSKHHNWNNGSSFKPYTVDWTRSLRISIRERDRYVCQLCSKKQGDVTFDVHHIDYDKENCNPNNLITLCHSCNMKVNFDRNYWTNLMMILRQ